MESMNLMPQQLLDKLAAVPLASPRSVNDAPPDPALTRLKELDLRRHLSRFEGLVLDDTGKTLCPVHQETHPSFEVKRHTDGHWYWFDWHNQGGDNFSGTIIDYYVSIKGMTVAEAIRVIRERESIQATVAPERTERQLSVIGTENPYDFLKTGSELQALDIRVEWAIERLIPARSLTLLYGRSGIGKTWLSLMIARAVSLGLPLFDLTAIRRPVVYVDYENPLSVLVDRVRKLDIRDVQFWHLSAETPPPKLDSPGWTLFKRLPQGSVLVFDTARACHNMEENSSEAPALVMGRLKELRELDHEIILLHHTTKADDQNAKGSSGWYDLADHTLSFCRAKRGALEEANDGGLEPGTVLSLGVGKKTRFESMPSIYLTLEPDAGGLVVAESQDAMAIEALAEYIAGPGRSRNQSEIIEWAKEAGVGPRQRASFIALLNRGERIHWHSHRGGGGRRIYEPII